MLHSFGSLNFKLFLKTMYYTLFSHEMVVTKLIKPIQIEHNNIRESWKDIAQFEINFLDRAKLRFRSTLLHLKSKRKVTYLF